MSDEDYYLDEPFRPVRPRIDRPLSALEKQLIAEAEEQEQKALEALKTGKQSAELSVRVYPSRNDEEWVAVDLYGLSPLGQCSVFMPKRVADVVVSFVAGVNESTRLIVNALIDEDQKLAVKHIAEMFRAARKTVGRPPEPYKGEVIEATLEWLSERQPQRLSVVGKAIKHYAAHLDKYPHKSTVKRWAKEAKDLDNQRRLKGS